MIQCHRTADFVSENCEKFYSSDLTEIEKLIESLEYEEYLFLQGKRTLAHDFRWRLEEARKSRNAVQKITEETKWRARTTHAVHKARCLLDYLDDQSQEA